MQTIAQKRAAFALERVLAVKGETGISNQEFKSYANALPAMIHMNGFGQAMAFCRSKAGDKGKGAAWQALFDMLSHWLIKEGQPFHGSTDLLKGITEKTMTVYMLGQAEALALCEWIKRFSNAYLADS